MDEEQIKLGEERAAKIEAANRKVPHELINGLVIPLTSQQVADLEAEWARVDAEHATPVYQAGLIEGRNFLPRADRELALLLPPESPKRIKAEAIEAQIIALEVRK